MYKTNPKKRKSDPSVGTQPARKKRKFNPPKFGNLPIKSQPSSSSLNLNPSGSAVKSSSAPPNNHSKSKKPKKFIAKIPTKGLPMKPKTKSNAKTTCKNGTTTQSAPKKEMIVRRKKKKFKFVPPKIVDHEKARKNLKAYVADLAKAYGQALGCLGFRKERTTLPKHDPDDEGAIVLWRPEELSDSDDSETDIEDDAEDDDDDEDTSTNFKIKVKNALAIQSKKQKKGKKQKVPIVVDPRLGKKLRAHQVVGVEFVYRCMMDSKYAANNEYGEGCILADGMGLGKTLQAIAVMWTLLEQDVFAGDQTCTNGIVISPASLVANWENEIKHWLPSANHTMTCYPCLTKTKDVIHKWLNAMRSPNCGITKPILIISYESFRAYHELICYKGGKAPKSGGQVMEDARAQRMKYDIGFVVCDEGHKLKNYKSQLSVAVSRIKSRKRLLLSGTPIQNDLKEMYSLVNFVNPGVWKSVKDFSSSACRIVRSFDATASKNVNQKGEEALTSVRSILNKFLLQRTSKVVMKYLPKKSEYVVFCKLSSFQELLYETFLKSKIARQAKAAASSGSGLSAIGFLAVAVLSKICNHPSLIYEACADIEGIKLDRTKWKLVSSASKNKGKRGKKKKKKTTSHRTDADYLNDGTRKRTELRGLFDLYPKTFISSYLNAEHSSKMAFTIALLLGLKGQNTGDKSVIVSVYTETLDILALILEKVGIAFKRLDGSIPTKKRQPIVDQFNDRNSPYLVLLLSNRAGGCGLNLIGANRLIMFDADWNPANDAQAMARVWRSGQLKETYIYRLFSTGTLEEKIFQRQTFKSDLAEQLVAAEEDMTDITEFAVKELKKIFIYNKKTDCDTLERTKKKGYTSWDKHKLCVNVGDVFLTRAAKHGKVSFLFKRIVNDPRLNKENENKEEKEENEEGESEDEWIDHDDKDSGDGSDAYVDKENINNNDSNHNIKKKEKKQKQKKKRLSVSSNKSNASVSSNKSNASVDCCEFDESPLISKRQKKRKLKRNNNRNGVILNLVSDSDSDDDNSDTF